MNHIQYMNTRVLHVLHAQNFVERRLEKQERMMNTVQSREYTTRDKIVYFLVTFTLAQGGAFITALFMQAVNGIYMALSAMLIACLALSALTRTYSRKTLVFGVFIGFLGSVVMVWLLYVSTGLWPLFMLVLLGPLFIAAVVELWNWFRA